jgi:hypothetical protein
VQIFRVHPPTTAEYAVDEDGNWSMDSMTTNFGNDPMPTHGEERTSVLAAVAAAQTSHFAEVGLVSRSVARHTEN